MLEKCIKITMCILYRYTNAPAIPLAEAMLGTQNHSFFIIGYQVVIAGMETFFTWENLNTSDLYATCCFWHHFFIELASEVSAEHQNISHESGHAFCPVACILMDIKYMAGFVNSDRISACENKHVQCDWWAVFGLTLMLLVLLCSVLCIFGINIHPHHEWNETSKRIGFSLREFRCINEYAIQNVYLLSFQSLLPICCYYISLCFYRFNLILIYFCSIVENQRL